MCTEVICIAGRYNKYLRNLSQSPWIDKNDVRITDSVQELLEEGLIKFLQYGRSTFASSGREDVDVRMLGKGRPFVFKLYEVENLDLFNDSMMMQIQEFLNARHEGKVQVRDLQVVTKESVSKHLKAGQESKTKEYRALCCSSRKITTEDFDKINSLKDLYIEQKTPIRVLHRRTMATRRRRIYSLKMEPVYLKDFDCIKSEELENVFTLRLLAEAGTYIKEFVHGDFERTQPNLSIILGGCETDLMELDVMEVYLDWPPHLPNQNSLDKVETAPYNQDEKMDQSSVDLIDLYDKAIKAMREAESMLRSDARQSRFIDAQKLFEEALSLVEKLALFSDNETLDDVSTENLKYLLIPAHLAKISTSIECSSDRLGTYVRAESNIKMYLQMISNYGLGCEKIEEAIKSDVSPILSSKPSAIGSAAQMRNEKIERYKKSKLLNERLEELESRLKSGQDVDDEVTREYYIGLIKKTTDETLDNLQTLVRPAIFFEKSRSSQPVVPASHQSHASSTLNQDKTITIVKDQLQKQVFGLGYPSKATVTVDEFISKKIKDGDIAFEAHKQVYSNSLQKYAEQPNLRREQEEMSDEERERKEECDDVEELARKRRWDEFKDDTPRGSGNRYNMG